jgi:hypothetical protein
MTPRSIALAALLACARPAGMTPRQHEGDGQHDVTHDEVLGGSREMSSVTPCVIDTAPQATVAFVRYKSTASVRPGQDTSIVLCRSTPDGVANIAWRLFRVPTAN